MSPHQQAARRHRMWFGSYKRSGELKKVQVWCFVKDGNLEFLTPADSFKVSRIRRNPSVVCYLGSESGPQVRGRAEVLSDANEIWRGYRAYWKTHPVLMLILARTIRKKIERGKQVMIRVLPAEPNPLAGMSDPQL